MVNEQSMAVGHQHRLMGDEGLKVGRSTIFLKPFSVSIVTTTLFWILFFPCHSCR